MKTEFLKELGLSEEQIQKVMAENGKDVEAQKAKASTKEAERAALETQLREANATIEQLKGMDVEGIQRAADEWKAKYEKDTKALQEQLAERDYSFAVREAVAGMKFTSESAKKAFIADLTAKKLPVQDGKLLGLADFAAAYKDADPGAFAPENGMPKLVLGSTNKPPLAEVTREQYQKMGYAQRLKLKTEQPELYKELTAKE